MGDMLVPTPILSLLALTSMVIQHNYLELARIQMVILQLLFRFQFGRALVILRPMLLSIPTTTVSVVTSTTRNDGN